MEFFDTIANFFAKIPQLNFGAADLFDIALVTFVIYQAIKLIRETRAFQLVKGLVVLLICYLLVYVFKMQASTYMFQYIFKNIFLILVVVFNPEIRQVIERMGKNGIGFIRQFLKGNGDTDNETVRTAIIEICKAVQRMSDSKTGALIVMEHDTLLGDVIKTGTAVDAEISHELIGNIFFPNSPLHDGAAVVRQGRLHSAGCVLPLTKSEAVSSDLGTRHRAALGMSELCDAMIIVVSEETGNISIAKEGKLTRDYSEADLREALLNYFVENSKKDDNSSVKKIMRGLKK